MGSGVAIGKHRVDLARLERGLVAVIPQAEHEFARAPAEKAFYFVLDPDNASSLIPVEIGRPAAAAPAQLSDLGPTAKVST